MNFIGGNGTRGWRQGICSMLDPGPAARLPRRPPRLPRGWLSVSSVISMLIEWPFMGSGYGFRLDINLPA
jgi:hypothetical protein